MLLFFSLLPPKLRTWLRTTLHLRECAGGETDELSERQSRMRKQTEEAEASGAASKVKANSQTACGHLAQHIVSLVGGACL